MTVAFEPGVWQMCSRPGGGVVVELRVAVWHRLRSAVRNDRTGAVPVPELDSVGIELVVGHVNRRPQRCAPAVTVGPWLVEADQRRPPVLLGLIGMESQRRGN